MIMSEFSKVRSEIVKIEGGEGTRH
jgi:hypothetical protein